MTGLQEKKLSREELQAVVETHSGLVRTVVGRLSCVYREERDDLMQIGYIGLLKAAQRFDPERGLQFSTYAVPVIAGEIRSQLRDQGAVKMSRSLKSDMALVRRTESDLLKLHGTQPHLSQIAEAAGISAERVQEACQAADVLLCMGELDSREAEGHRALWTECEEENVRRMDLKAALTELDAQARKVIVLRYYRDYTQQQTAETLGISQVQVCRIEKRTLKKMAEKCRD